MERIVASHPRSRVTIDLRGIAPRLHAHAAARGKTTAAVVRAAVVAMLDAEGATDDPGVATNRVDARTVKVTLRLGASHAARLGDRARSAELSQGAYVAALLDGIAASPRSIDHGDAIAALADSTQKVAAMSADINALIRLVRHFNSDDAQKYRAGLMTLSQDMRLHLQVASRLVAGLTSKTRSSSSAERT